MEKIYVKARAKLNLTLNILNKREDGYHDLESVFQKIGLYDELYVEKTNSNHIELVCNVKELENENNIIWKAYNVLKQMHPNISGIKVTLIKHIPIQAGLGGGSTDCATFLNSMNSLFNLGYSKQELVDIGKNLGADVPPCLYENSMLGQGIGEIITPIDTNMKYYVVIIKPQVSFSTKSMFDTIDNHPEFSQNYNSQDTITALQTNNLSLLSSNLYNAFEEVVKDNPEIQNVKKLLYENKAVR